MISSSGAFGIFIAYKGCTGVRVYMPCGCNAKRVDLGNGIEYEEDYLNDSGGHGSGVLVGECNTV
jgi:hypothetical protein